MLHLQQLLPANGRVGVPSTASAASAAFRTVFSLTPKISPTYREGACALKRAKNFRPFRETVGWARRRSPSCRAGALRHENAVNLTAFSVDGLWGASGGDTDATDATVISESPLRRAFWGIFRNYRGIRGIRGMRVARREKNPPQSTHSRGVCVERGTERSYANGSSSSEGVRRRIPRQQRTLLFSRRVCVGR
jgi:hypothetical protein